jgi:serine protease inhibitor
MVRYIYVAALCILVLSVNTCSKSSEPEQEKTTDPFSGSDVTQAELAAAESTLSAATLDFGLRLFREVVSQSGPTENVFISPLSVIYALTMASNGADGETKQAFASLMGTEGISDQALDLEPRRQGFGTRFRDDMPGVP